MFSAALLAQAKKLLADARAKGLRIATAESCTGGLIAGLLTEIPGSSTSIRKDAANASEKSRPTIFRVLLPPAVTGGETCTPATQLAGTIVFATTSATTTATAAATGCT